MIDLSHVSQLLIPIAHAQETAAPSGGIVETLGINWKLFIAQLVNFGIILFILWKWVFGPVAKRLEERSNKIEKSLNDADRIEKEKREFEAWRQEELNKARKQAAEFITAAQTDAQKAREEVVKKTKDDQEKLIAQAKERIESDKQKALQDAKSELANLITNATEKILRKKLDAKADQELVKESLANIKQF